MAACELAAVFEVAADHVCVELSDAAPVGSLAGLGAVLSGRDLGPSHVVAVRHAGIWANDTLFVVVFRRIEPVTSTNSDEQQGAGKPPSSFHYFFFRDAQISNRIAAEQLF